MDNVQNCDSCTNISSSQTYSTYLKNGFMWLDVVRGVRRDDNHDDVVIGSVDQMLLRLW
jgi:hypothetical protein